jgi:hypothetical protein
VLKKATASFTSSSQEGESPLERVVQQQQEQKEEKPEECVNLITMDEVDEVGNEFISSFEQFLAESTAQSSSAAPSGLEHDE